MFDSLIHMSGVSTGTSVMLVLSLHVVFFLKEDNTGLFPANT